MDNRKVKEGVVAKLKERLENAKVVILTDYRGLNVADVTDLRRKLREEGVDFKVVKNTLTKRAASELNYESLHPYLEGPTAIAFGNDDPVIAAKILAKFAKTNDKLTIKAGLLEGNLVDIAGFKVLADLPPREVLLSHVLGTFASPLSAFAGVLEGNMRNLVYVLDAVAKQKEESA